MHQIRDVRVPVDEDALRVIEECAGWERAGGHKDVREEGGAEVDPFWGSGGDAAVQDFVAEGTEDDKAELDVDVHEAGAVADEAF